MRKLACHAKMSSCAPVKPCLIATFLLRFLAAFNVLVQWHGFQPNVSGFGPSRSLNLVCKIPI
jgi:hypothetical protein